jgi:hypothetical protein
MAKLRVVQVSSQLGLRGTEKALEVLSRHLYRQVFDGFLAGVQSGPRQIGVLTGNAARPGR